MNQQNNTLKMSRTRVVILIVLLGGALLAVIYGAISNREKKLTYLSGTEVAEVNSQQFPRNAIPADALVVMSIRPAQLLEMPALALVREELTSQKSQQQGVTILGLELDNLNRLTLILTRPSSGSSFDPDQFSATIIQSNRDLNQTVILNKFRRGRYVQKVDALNQKTLYLGYNDKALLFLDSKTLILSESFEAMDSIMRTLQNKKEKPWENNWQVNENDLFVSMWNQQQISKTLKEFNQLETIRSVPLMELFSPIWDNTKLITLGVGFDDRFSLELKLFQNQNGESVRENLHKAISFALMRLSESKLELPADWQPASQDSISKILSNSINDSELAQCGETVRFRTSVPTDSGAILLKQMVPVIFDLQETQHRAISKHNMKQIVFALHEYYDDHQHFPPAVVLGPDGKTPHSWRVELLPYLDQRALYDSYRMNEPWDSEHNLKISKTVIPVFSNPNSSKPTNTSYFVVVGPDTPFGDKNGIKLTDIPGGTEKTLAVIEAKRDIPWTKPEDLPFDGKVVPEFGGFHQGGYFVGLCNGKVHFLSVLTDKEYLKTLLTTSDDSPL